MTIVRIGSTKDYAENWAQAFGKKKVRAKTVKRPAAKSATAGGSKKVAKSNKKV